MSASPEIGFGIAAWAVMKFTLHHLRARGVLTQAEGADIIETSLQLLESLDGKLGGEPLRSARGHLEDWIHQWHVTAAPSSTPPSEPPS